MFRRIVCLIPVILMIGSVVFADSHTTNDPNTDPDANACYEGGTLEGKCDTEWEWNAGWYLIRFEYGLLTEDEIPLAYQSILPDPEPDTIPEETTPEEEPVVLTPLPAGCYSSGTSSLLWSGGVGPATGDFYPVNDRGCLSTPSGKATYVVAPDAETAATLCTLQRDTPTAFFTPNDEFFFICQ